MLATRVLGKTGLQVTELGFGAMNLRLVKPPAALKTLAFVLRSGINFIDTSETYNREFPDGTRSVSEALIGEAIRQWGAPGEIIISTKGHGYNPKGCMECLHGSLKRIGIEGNGPDRHIGKTPVRLIYMLHGLNRERWDETKRTGCVPKALVPARAQGLIDYIGFSGHDQEVMAEVIRSGLFEVVEMRYNVFDRDARHTAVAGRSSRRTSRQLLELARQQGMGIVNMKPFGGNGMQPLLRVITAEAVMVQYQRMLRYCLAEPALSTVIPGAATEEQARECYDAALEGPLPEDEQRALEEQADRIIKVIGSDYCRGCRHCLDDAPGFECPNSVPFDEILILDSRRKVAAAAGLSLDHLKALYRRLPVDASVCDRCGQCRARCIYDIPIEDMLQAAHRELTA